MSEDFSSDILWGVARIGEAAGVYHKDGTVNTKVTSDRLKSGIIPGFKRGRLWQSARSLIQQKLTSGDTA
ncbi:MAG: hypothetical protein ACLQF4_13285 [Xanthobacteraceae bacterium]